MQSIEIEPRTAEYPDEYIAAIKADAERGAIRVAEFLKRALIHARGGEAGSPLPVVLPAEFLLGLDCALRLGAWELIGIGDIGLPSAEHVLDLVMRFKQGPELATYVHLVHRRALDIYLERFVWQIGTELEVDLALTVDDDEAFLDALADFLCERRQSL